MQGTKSLVKNAMLLETKNTRDQDGNAGFTKVDRTDCKAKF
jgi:hypothetical protein